MVHLPAIPRSSHTSPAPFILAVIRTCDITETHRSLDIQYYTRDSTLDVLDITTIQCLVGRIRDRDRWAIIDRSGALSRAIYTPDDDDDVPTD